MVVSTSSVTPGLFEVCRGYIPPRFPEIPLQNIHYDKHQRRSEGATATVFPANLKTANGNNLKVAVKEYKHLVDSSKDVKVRDAVSTSKPLRFIEWNRRLPKNCEMRGNCDIRTLSR